MTLSFEEYDLIVGADGVASAVRCGAGRALRSSPVPGTEVSITTSLAVTHVLFSSLPFLLFSCQVRAALAAQLPGFRFEQRADALCFKVSRAFPFSPPFLPSFSSFFSLSPASALSSPRTRSA